MVMLDSRKSAFRFINVWHDNLGLYNLSRSVTQLQ